MRSIVVAAILNAAILFLLSSLEFGGGLSATPAVALLLLQGAAVAVSFVALYAAMMNWCNPNQTATDFALLQSVDAVLAIAASAVAGLIGQFLGNASLFLAAGAVIVLAVLASPRFLGPSGRQETLPHFKAKVSEQ